MYKLSLIAALLLTTLTMNAQSKQEKEVADAVEKLRKAMVDADSVALSSVAADGLTYGHSSGDRVLQAIASLCASLVCPMDLVGRYGGEEFVVLLPGADAATAHEVAERLRQGIATTPIALPQGSLTITVSLGYATRTAAHPDLPHLVDCADTALYAAKAAGRNCTRRWAPDPPPEGAAP